MSPRYSQSGGNGQPASGRPGNEDERSFTTGIGSMVAPPANDETAPQPTFTASPGGTAGTVLPDNTVPEPAPAPDDAAGAGDSVPGTPTRGLDETAEPEQTLPDVPVPGADDSAASETAVQTGDAPSAGLAPAGGLAPDAGNRPLPATAGLDEPLLSDAAGLRARWQQVQAGFVDDPRESVGNAADLIEQTAQALVGALRQRQRQLRVMWEGGPAGDSAPADGESATRGADTEHLRQMMRQYRALFNQLCRP